jgi:hypothetical protein
MGLVGFLYDKMGTYNIALYVSGRFLVWQDGDLQHNVCMGLVGFLYEKLPCLFTLSTTCIFHQWTKRFSSRWRICRIFFTVQWYFFTSGISHPKRGYYLGMTSALNRWTSIDAFAGITKGCREVLDTTWDKVCQRLLAGWWFSLGTRVSSTNKTDCHDTTEIGICCFSAKHAAFNEKE